MTKMFPVIDMAATGANILRLRKARGLTVRDLQDWFGFEEPQAIYKWQKGKSLPTVDNLYALGALLEDIQAPEPQEALVRRELENTLDTLLSSLNDRQQQILRLHFGLDDGKAHSLEEIGKMMNISKERARQIERQAMEKLQKMGSSLGLEDFLE